MKITITAQLRNGLLWEGVQKLGSQSALAKYLGVAPSKLGEWVNFKSTPNYTRHSEKRDLIEQRLMDLLGYTLEQIFPEEIKTEAFQKRQKRLERSMDVSAEQLSEAKLLDALPPAPDDVILLQERNETISKVIKTLRPRSQAILKFRYGLDGEDPHTLEEAHQKFGVTKSRILQIENKALRDLRHPLRSKQLKVFLK